MRKRLLSVGTNHTLLGIRNLVLASAGYEVIAARTGAGAINAINSCGLDAVIVGHSLSPSLKQRVVQAAKSKSLAVIVLHATPYEKQIPSADANLCGIDGAATIMEVLAKLLTGAGDGAPSELQQHDAEGDQSCGGPAAGTHVLAQDIFRQKGFQQITGGRGRHSKTDGRNREQGQQGKKGNGQRNEATEDQRVVHDLFDHVEQAPGA